MWAGAVVAATDPRASSPFLGSIVLAACALPGVLASNAWAEEAPVDGVIAFKLSHYQDSQTGSYGGNTAAAAAGVSHALSAGPVAASGSNYATISSASSGGGGGGGNGGTPSAEVNRIKVQTPSLYALVPINRHWAAEGSLTVDDVSGASPQYYTDMRSAAHFVDRRKAGDAKLTYYADRQSYALGVAKSSESDFFSSAISAEARFANADQNTTWNVGLGITHDRIDPTTHIVSNETRRTNELQVGVTQMLGSQDLLQATFTLSRANGYNNDPYKLNDARPRDHNADILQLRWNHWLGGSALKVGYRLFKDSYSILAHTLDMALAVPFEHGLTVTPGLRYYTQNAASFYANPNASTYPGPAGTPAYFSADQRLAAFGAFAMNLKVSAEMAPTWMIDGKVELYRQRSSWRFAGQSGSPGLNPLNSSTWQVGVNHGF